MPLGPHCCRFAFTFAAAAGANVFAHGLWDTNRSLWGGWAIEGGGFKVIHTGDLGYSRHSSSST